ncbi:MAG: hypothetical protein QNJ12_17870 [Ilumatobacter sp.]|uniref:LolA family protein n=1 Tax=Ilumatobacter sp. TaxID=1967498 RepID=UPI0026296486|nr:hypothetical protein [Ilumatobacter sp.]MDJ0770666.1 hypothetical protein [Ilumatobacter sp.]
MTSDGAAGRTPTWTELLGRMAAVSFRTATGTISYRDPDEQEDADRSGELRFWFRHPDSWRIEDGDGVRYVRRDETVWFRDGQGRMQRLTGGMNWSGPGDPRQLLSGRDLVDSLTSSNDYSVPSGPPTAAVVGGRAGWRVVLEPPPLKHHPLAVVVDDETGVVLEMRSTVLDAHTTLIGFLPDADIDDARFEYDGPIATDWEDERRHRREVDRLGREREWPAPRYWPPGVELDLLDADDSTGAFIGFLHGVSSVAVFARWPAGGEPHPALDSYSESHHVHRWTADGFDWALAVAQPFGDDDLRRLIGSIPPEPPREA